LEVNPTIFCAVPLVYQRLLDAYKDHISMAFGKNIKFLFCGGADCSPEMRRAYSGFNFLQAYALSETASSFAIDYPDDRDDYSAGTIFENIDVKIADEKDGIGEIIVKGDNVFLGYTDPKLTAEVMDENGYLHTGDLGYLKGNKLYVTGRKKKILVASNGQNIDVAEITDLLKSKSDNIVKVHFSLDGNLLNAVIYVSDTSIDVKAAVEEFNKEVPGNERIINYEVKQHVIGNK
jgi:long-chain acyl-CoA synthetase